MKNKNLVALATIALFWLSACEKDKTTDPKPIVTNRIDYLLVDEAQERLLIYGKFPAQNGSVSINNVPLTVSEWSTVLITCKVPFSNAEDYGDVVVESGDSKSAPKRLYKWVIEFNCKRPHGGIGGDIMEEVSGTVSIRGDIRPAPAHVLTSGYSELFGGGHAIFKAGGTAHSEYDCGTITAEWPHTEKLVNRTLQMEDLSGQTHFQGFKKILPTGFDLYLDFEAWEVIPARVTTSPCSGPASVYEYLQSSQLFGLDGYDPLPLRFKPGTNNIQSDTIVEDVYSSAKLIWKMEDGHLYKRQGILTWSSVQLPPD